MFESIQDYFKWVTLGKSKHKVYEASDEVGSEHGRIEKRKFEAALDFIKNILYFNYVYID